MIAPEGYVSLSELIKIAYSENRSMDVDFYSDSISDFVYCRRDDFILDRLLKRLIFQNCYVTNGTENTVRVNSDILNYRFPIHGLPDRNAIYKPLPKLECHRLLNKFRVGEAISSEDYNHYYFITDRNHLDWISLKRVLSHTSGHTRPFLFIENETYSVNLELFYYLKKHSDKYNFNKKKFDAYLPLLKRLEGRFICTTTSAFEEGWASIWTEEYELLAENKVALPLDIRSNAGERKSGVRGRGQPSKEQKLHDKIKEMYSDGVPVSVYRLDKELKMAGFATSERSIRRLRGKFPKLFKS